MRGGTVRNHGLFQFTQGGQKYSLLTLIMETFSLHTNEADSGNDLSLFCDELWRFVTWRNAIFASHRPSLSENVSISCDQKSKSAIYFWHGMSRDVMWRYRLRHRDKETRHFSSECYWDLMTMCKTTASLATVTYTDRRRTSGRKKSRFMMIV